MSENELIKAVNDLIQKGQGDYGRNNYILKMLKEGKTLYKTDQKYLAKFCKIKIQQNSVLHSPKPILKNNVKEKIKPTKKTIVENKKGSNASSIVTLMLLASIGIGILFLLYFTSFEIESLRQLSSKEIFTYVSEFVLWTESLTLIEFVVIIAFTVVVDIARNLAKCAILIGHAIKRKLNPLELNLERPKISVIIPARNEAASINNTIMSVLENRYSNKEIIVVDDYSTDDTYKIALTFHKRGLIKLLRRTHGKGSKASAINYGTLFATGDHLLIMDADTVLQRNALEEISKYSTVPGVAAVAGNVRILSGDKGVKNLLTRCQSYEYLINLEIGRRYNALMRMLLIIPGAFGLFSKKIAREVGFYDKDTSTEDFDLTMKLLKTGDRIEFVSNAIAWTYCPNNWSAWIKQRVRWTHGQLSTILKHKDIFKNTRFRRPLTIALYDMIIMDIVLLFVRIAGLVWLITIFSEEIIFVYTFIFILYILNEFIVIGTAIGFSPNKADIKYAVLTPFIVFVYRPIYAYVRFYAYLLRIMNKEINW